MSTQLGGTSLLVSERARVTVRFVDGSTWNDGGHGTRKAALAYAKRYAR